MTLESLLVPARAYWSIFLPETMTNGCKFFKVLFRLIDFSLLFDTLLCLLKDDEGFIEPLENFIYFYFNMNC